MIDSLTPTKAHVMAYQPPIRVWERTETGWASRDWKPGEKNEYARDVLGWVSAQQREDKDKPA